MGEMDVASGVGVLRTLLGSCVGLALYDARSKTGGLAHIMLPLSRDAGGPDGKFVDTAIPALIRRMEKLAKAKIRPVARLAGGANMFAASNSQTIGAQNIEASEQMLRELGIPVLGRHCGGVKGRRMSLDAGTGRVLVEVVGDAVIEL